MLVLGRALQIHSMLTLSKTLLKAITNGCGHDMNAKQTIGEEQVLMPDTSLQDELLVFSLQTITVEGRTTGVSRNIFVLEPTVEPLGSGATDGLAISSLETTVIGSEVASTNHSTFV